MRRLMMILIGCVLVMSQGFGNVAADEDGADGALLRKLAGVYSLTAQGSIAFCFHNAPPFPQVQCGSPDSVVIPLIVLDVGVSTRDAKGNTCSTVTETDTDLPPGAFPPGVFVLNSVSKLTSYDPTTGTGDESVTGYFGGKCQGSTFDSNGATVISSITDHFTVSNSGKRIDGIVTSLTNPGGSVASFSYSFALQRK